MISRTNDWHKFVIQLSVAAPYYKFEFYSADKHYDWLGITEQTGIVFVKDPALMPKHSTTRRNIVWTFRNETHNKTGSILLLITTEGEVILQALVTTNRGCVQEMKMKAVVRLPAVEDLRLAHASGERVPLTRDGPTEHYATCSPDLSACPNGQCDELEMLQPTLCPQDCAREIQGEAKRWKSGQGLHAAVVPASVRRETGAPA
ncbi:uncharacterized protein CEXT_760281 [Caerostris extrusa]|uniref:RET cysteine rich domain-containing protein n=1 Tax=Caerostris extrusa TaxID=172846 RepID=A0AAV4SL65_CAEEX|nr:uncharacterized protein CEXT_760281 [Caerostris extrusa]